MYSQSIPNNVVLEYIKDREFTFFPQF